MRYAPNAYQANNNRYARDFIQSIEFIIIKCGAAVLTAMHSSVNARAFVCICIRAKRARAGLEEEHRTKVSGNAINRFNS